MGTTSASTVAMSATPEGMSTASEATSTATEGTSTAATEGTAAASEGALLEPAARLRSALSVHGLVLEALHLSAAALH